MLAPIHLSRRHYMDAILAVLDRVGGRAPAREVGASVRLELGRYMTEVDLGGVPSNPNEPRWWNDTRWARDHLVDAGFLAPCVISGHGVWSLTPSGRAEAPNALARLNHSSTGPRGGDRSGRSGVPPGRAAQLTFLAAVFRRAHETPVGCTDHQVMLDLMVTLEELVAEGFARPTRPQGAFPGTRGGPSATSADTWHAPPTPTSTLVPNSMDPARMAAFIAGPWLAAVTRMLRLTETEKATRSDELDMLASLPAVAALVAVKSGWLCAAKAAEMAVRSVRLVMTEYDRPGGLVGGLPLAEPGDVATAIRDGLFHRVLTGWVHHLDLSGDDTLALRAGVIRTWLVSLRSLLGDPEATGPQKIDPLWRWLFDGDPTFEPPREDGVEEAAAELASWFATQPPGQSEAPEKGALMWHHLHGWAVAKGDSANRFDPSFSVYILARAEVLRLKFPSKTGWVHVGRAVQTASCPEFVRNAAARVAVAARQAEGRS